MGFNVVSGTAARSVAYSVDRVRVRVRVRFNVQIKYSNSMIFKNSLSAS